MPAKIIQPNSEPFKKIDIDPITLDIIESALKSARYEMDFSKPAKRYCALGTAEQVASTIREFYQAGVRHLVVDFIAERADQIEQIDYFGADVMPLLADLIQHPPA